MLTKQTSQAKLWLDETGNSIPYSRTTASERARETMAHSIATKAVKMNESLQVLKKFMEDTCDSVIEAVRKDHKIKADSKGNYTWFNFDHSIKIEVNVHSLLQFDETIMTAAQDVLTSLLQDNISGEDFIKSIVMEAFQTSGGKLDARRIIGLKKHTRRITNKAIKEQWQNAMDLIDQSVSRPDSRRYIRVWERNEKGEYENINLNFSSI